MSTNPDDLLNNFQDQFEYLDLLLPDCNGVIRGKRVPSNTAEKIFSEGAMFPASLFASDISGEPCEETGLGFDMGDADYICPAIQASLTPVPWAPGRAQVLLNMQNPDGSPFLANPREVLRNIIHRIQADGYHPCIAVELEFYLLHQEFEGKPKPPINPFTQQPEQSSQVYYMDDLDAYGEFIEAIQNTCDIQNIRADAAVSECAPGQFEINLLHTHDIIKACDDALLLKRAVKHVARQMGYQATFMAKPYFDQSGCGSHVHVSCYDEQGENIFAADEANLHHAIGGMQQTLAQAMLLYAPHANSYRRFRPDSYVALNNSWGYNNRTVALRIPLSKPDSLRIEHRLAGADTNPYLVVAAVLAGMHWGLQQKCNCDEAISGNAYAKSKPSNPYHWQQSINLFSNSSWIKNYFGSEFQKVFSHLKQAEINHFNQTITPLEYDWYLQTI
ncbi:glutamine synthetase family protein [Halioxenophilus sp. WMMB6]|uniref:glutamine synthetase family protein n=1 Tax=Halioxenophilus sp. WMMB6 TaxID=3073815 RepID=UPI00295E50E0|nr:glutamine synthetase family protein [Halioxenophilus sp. WMMB6]